MSDKYNPYSGQREGTSGSPISITSDVEKQDTMDSNLKEHKKDLMGTLRNARSVRRSIIQKMGASPYVQGNETEFLADCTKFTKVDEAIFHMTKHLEVVDLELDKLRVNKRLAQQIIFWATTAFRHGLRKYKPGHRTCACW
jgi:hypothetical protein